MKKMLLLMVAVVATGFMAANVAAVEVSGLYVGVKGIYGYTFMEDTRSQYIGFYTNSMKFNDTSDSAFGGALSVGYDFSKRLDFPVRAELEYALFSKVGTERSYVYSFSSNDYLGEQKFKIQTLFLNVYYDFDLGTALTPYLNGGIGWAFIDTKLYPHCNYGDPTVNSSAVTRTNFAWNLGMGAAYSLTDNLSLDAGYRFVSLGSAKTKNGLDCWYDTFYLKTKNLHMHQLYLGARYAF